MVYMEATTTPEIRTYETFDVRMASGSTCTGFDTAAEAQAFSPTGEVIRHTFTVEVKPESAHLYRKGI